LEAAVTVGGAAAFLLREGEEVDWTSERR